MVIGLLEIPYGLAHLGQLPLQLHLVVLEGDLMLDVILSCTRLLLLSDCLGPGRRVGLQVELVEGLFFESATVAQFERLRLFCLCWFFLQNFDVAAVDRALIHVLFR